MLFNQIEYSWGLLAGLQRAAIDNSNELCVIDFGGSLGSSYFQNKDFLNNLKSIKWCIVEQSHFTECGKENFENDQLRFYYSINECLKENKPTVLILSSVLQYLEEPKKCIEEFLNVDFAYIIIDRTGFIEDDNEIVCLQNVPSYIYEASYPCWFFEKNAFLELFKKKYSVISYFDSGYTPPQKLNGKKIYWDGLILKRK